MEIYILTFLPPLLIILYFYYSDRFPEPKSSIIQVFFLGILITIPVGFINEIFIWSVEEETGQLLAYRAGITEEFLKFVCLYLLVSKRNFFNEPMDAIVYGVCISLGFSLMETLEWSRIYLIDYGESSAIVHAQSRAWSSNTMHAGCGIVMGYILSNAFFKKKNSFLKLFLALFIPILIHGFYNFGIGVGAAPLSYLLLTICAVFVLFGWKESRERQKLKKMEPEDKVFSLNFINVSGSLILNLIIISSIIYIFK